MTSSRARSFLFVAVAAASGLLSPCAAPQGDAKAAAGYDSVVTNPIRTDADKGMDASRHPTEFLAFAQVKPGMQVMDVSAGAGYTTQILALAVGPSGKVFAQTPRPSVNLQKRLADHPQANLVLVERSFEDPIPADAPKLDLITLVLNYHDITYLPVDRAKMNAALFAALKPGGHFVVVDHSGRKGTGITEGKTLHRIEESVVVDEVKKAGFVLEAEGNFLRNPADARDDPSGQPKVPTD